MSFAAGLVQEVWISLFKTLTAGTAFPDEFCFVAFLGTVTRRCVRLQLRMHANGAKRSMEREEPRPAGSDTPSQEPDPAESVAASELLERWLDGSATLDERAVLVWSLRGCRGQELADSMGMNVRTMRRMLQRARARWTTVAGGLSR
jgi:RNA polymerase sigma factor (sigma-70 family)